MVTNLNIIKFLEKNNNEKYNKIKFINRYNEVSNLKIKDSGKTINIRDIKLINNNKINFSKTNFIKIIDNKLLILKVFGDYKDNKLYLRIKKIEEIYIKDNNIIIKNKNDIHLNYLIYLLKKIKTPKDIINKLKILNFFDSKLQNNVKYGEFINKSYSYNLRYDNINSILKRDSNTLKYIKKYSAIVYHNYHIDDKLLNNYDLFFINNLLLYKNKLSDNQTLILNEILDIYKNWNFNLRKKICKLIITQKTNIYYMILDILDKWNEFNYNNYYLNMVNYEVSKNKFIETYIYLYTIVKAAPSIEIISIKLSNKIKKINPINVSQIFFLTTLLDNFDINFFLYTHNDDLLFSLSLLNKVTLSDIEKEYILFLKKNNYYNKELFLKANNIKTVNLVEFLLNKNNYKHNIDIYDYKIDEFSANIIYYTLLNFISISEYSLTSDLVNIIEAINNIIKNNKDNIDIYMLINDIFKQITNEGFYELLLSYDMIDSNSDYGDKKFLINHYNYDNFQLWFVNTLNKINKENSFSNLYTLYNK